MIFQKAYISFSLVLLLVTWSPNPTSGWFTQAGERVHRHIGVNTSDCDCPSYMWLSCTSFTLVTEHSGLGRWLMGMTFPPSVVIPSFRSSDTCASPFLRKASKVRELPLFFVAILAIFVVISFSISKEMVLTKILISSFSEAEVSTLAVVFPVTVPLNSPLASIHSFKNIN